MATFIYDIKKLKFSVADIDQVKKDFTRDAKLIFINGKSLKAIYKDMNLIVKKESDLQEEHLSTIWDNCFNGADREQLAAWKNFAEALLHQGGLLYAFEAALKETVSMPENNNSQPYYPKELTKEVHISFDKHYLTIQEKCIFTRFKDFSGDEENDLVAKKGSYLISASLTHLISLTEKKGELSFQHVIVQPEYKCKHSELQKCLNQKKLSIWEALKNIIRRIFRLKPEPNNLSFFKKPCYEAQISQSALIMKNDTCNMLEDSYTKINNHG